MSFRKPVSIDFSARMYTHNAAAAMNSNTSKGFTTWVNKDIKKAAATGDWSELMAKAELKTKYFRNNFYR